MSNGIKKWYLKRWGIANFYKYDIYQVMAGMDFWFEAIPLMPGLVTRTAEDEKVLRVLLENDVKNYLRFQQKVR